MSARGVQEARKRWPLAVWIIGEGNYASVSLCDPRPTVMLFQSQAEAEIAKAQIDDTACCGGCTGRHEIVHLEGLK
jgi:hypothetical protein